MAQSCPSCGAPLVVGASACAACGNRVSEEMIGIAETIPQIPGGAKPAADTMPCPMCSEPIPRGAATCKWCGEAVGGRPGGMGAQPVRPMPPPAYAPPPPQAMAAPDGSSVLIVGIIAIAGLITGCTLLAGPFAWIMGSNYEKKCAALGVEPDGSGKAGKILGIIATVLLGLSILCFGGYFLLIALAIGGGAMQH
jgi:hypothetical protein